MNNEVIVTNKNSTSFVASYKGIKFNFEPNEKIAMPLEAAVVIFGFNQSNKGPAMQRLGLSTNPNGAEFYRNIDFKYVEYIRKDDAEEIEQLKIDLEAKQVEIENLSSELKKAQTEIDQLQGKLEKASKKQK